VTPVGAAEEIVAALPEAVARLEIISGAGHWAWKDVPERYWPLIVEFVDRAASREAVEAQAG
jgi:pimeloyl-ACP methyl ester carboxylesterase